MIACRLREVAHDEVHKGCSIDAVPAQSISEDLPHVQSAPIAHRLARIGPCARSQSPSKIESGWYCQSGKINEF